MTSKDDIKAQKRIRAEIDLYKLFKGKYVYKGFPENKEVTNEGEIVTRNGIAAFSSEKMLYVGTMLVDWKVLESATDVLDFYEKPWKWETEIHLLWCTLERPEYDEALDDCKEYEIISDLLDRQLCWRTDVEEYCNEKIADLKSDLEVHIQCLGPL